MTDMVAKREYGQRRANETGRAYLMTSMGHVFMDCPLNRRMAEECGGIATTFHPEPEPAPVYQAENGHGTG